MTARPNPAAAWVVFALALALRLGFVLTLEERLAWPDEHEYVDIAHRLAAGDGFVATSYRSAPGLPAFLALVFGAFGDGLLAARVAQALLGALTCVLVLYTGALLASPATALLAAALLAVYPPHVYVAGVFYTTALETFLCAAAVYLAARVLRGGDGAGTAALCGVVVGATVLTRPVFVVLVPALAGLWLLAGAGPWRRGIVLAAALAAGAAAIVLPWSARNQAVYGRFVLVSSGGGITLWKGNNELADGTADDRFLGWGREVWQARRERLAAPAQAALDAKYAAVRARVEAREREVGDWYLAMDDVLAPVARAYVVAEPGRALARSTRKIATFFSAFSRTSTDALSRASVLLAAASFYPVLLLATVGAVLAPARAPGLLLPYAVVAALAVVHAGLTSCTRFRLAVDPYLILGASFALLELLRRHGRHGRAGAIG